MINDTNAPSESKQDERSKSMNNTATTATRNQESKMKNSITSGIPTGNGDQVVRFESINELLRYSFSDTSVLKAKQYSMITETKKYIIPVLPEDYGEYQLYCHLGGSVRYNFYPKAAIFQEKGIDGGLSINIGYNNQYNDYTGKTKENIISEEFYKNKVAVVENDGNWYAYSKTPDPPYNFDPNTFVRNTNIITLYEGRYLISINLPDFKDEVIREIMNDIKFKTVSLKG